MKNNNIVELILFSKYSLTDLRRRELVKWLGTTLQRAISQQHDIAKKFHFKTLKDSPVIYLS